MYGWAHSLTHDHHSAEDVVQEALVRAFLHVGQLVENSRFTPWLAQIVRNQAYMKLRRGGPFAKERPFSGFEIEAGASTGRSSDWRDIDKVLFHLGRHSEETVRHSQDPAAALMRKEMIEGIRQMLACLSPREKHIFEAHFFRHVTPKEIALLLDTSVANVYNSLSRARGKMQRERLRMHVSMYVRHRRDARKPLAKLLAPPALWHPVL